MSESNVDVAAVARVARRVELRDIRLIDITAHSASPSQGVLKPAVTHVCTGKLLNPNLIEVICHYSFTFAQAGTQVGLATFSYLIVYDLTGTDPVEDEDLKEFSFANGTYHSWPFARQLLFDLTSRLGFPPYSLPVFKFIQRPRPAQPTEPVEANTEPQPTTPKVKAPVS